MRKKTWLFVTSLFLLAGCISAQMRWVAADSINQTLPPSVRLYFSADSIADKPNIAYYIEADLKDPNLVFDMDTTYKRRLTPQRYYEKNNHPLVVVNGTFFSFETNQNLNTVIDNGLPVSYNVRSVRGRGKDSSSQIRIYRSAIGIRAGNADVAWVNSDTTQYAVKASQTPVKPEKILPPDTTIPEKAKRKLEKKTVRQKNKIFKPWNMETAIGGGPVLVQNGEIKITNEEEMMFTGKAINDRHPRTAMGYTAKGKLIILVVQGRFAKLAEGASLVHEAQILKDLGCVEALNLDGGGSSCMLVNGKETIKPSDKTGQRAVPAVFMIFRKK
jgi:hypothetical protein